RRDAVLDGYGPLFDADLRAYREALVAFASHPLVESGLYFVNRALLPKARDLARRDAAAWNKDDRQTAARIASYVVRFATKTSPNGVFCSVASATIGGERVVVEGEPEIERIECLLSVAEARKVAACLAVDPALEPAIVPRPNPTLRDDGDGSLTFWKPAT